MKKPNALNSINHYFYWLPFTMVCSLATFIMIPTSKGSGLYGFSNAKEYYTFPVKIVRGIVTDVSGNPLAGVSITVENTKIGTMSNEKGEFELKDVANNAILIFSSINYETQKIKLDGKDLLTVIMQPNANNLEEVIVSYGKQKRREVTGSIAQINASEVKDMPVGQFAQRLQGKIAGVQININTGKPGQGLGVRIRGAASINAGNKPLYVVDGQPISGDINNINPDEIENFTILKDASATALYGSRAANGVVLITTKQAKPGKMQIGFDAYYGLASFDRSHVPPIANARELATYMKAFFEDKIKYENWKDPATGLAEVPDEYANPEKYGEGTNWLNRVLRTAPVQNYSLSVSDSREKSSTSVVAGYSNQQGILKNTGYERYSVRLNTEFRPTSKIRLGFNIAPSLQIDHNSLGIKSDGQRQIVEGSLLSSPTISPYNADGSLVDLQSGYFVKMEPNWEKVAMATKDDYRTTRVLGNSFLEIQFFKGLKFKTAADIDLQGITRNNFVNTVAAAGYNAPPPRPVTSITGLYSTNNYLSWLNENTLNYQTVFSNDHHVEALVGYSVQKYSEHFNSANGSNYSDQSIPYVSAAGTTTGSSGTTANSLISMIGRINYDYKGKYLLSGAIRQDGSSRFGEQRKYGVFPSVSAGWIVTDEAFLKDVSFVNFLKLRASYGTTGNNNIGDYPSNSLIGPTSYVFNNTKVGGKIVTQLGNGMLSWEKNNQFDIGVDVGLFNDRITFTYDYYNKITDGLLYQINIPQSSGFSSVNSNIGTFAFWGHEFSISSINLKGRLKWNTDFNISFERNRIEKLGTQNLPLLPANEYNQPWINAVGHPLSMFYGYINDGVYMNQHEFDTQPKHATSQVGTVRMKDVNEDGKITSDDRTFIGNPNPDFRVGFSNNLSYNNFDLSITFSGAIGGDIEDGLAESTENLDGAFNVYKRDIDHRRSEADPGNGIVPRTLVGTTALYRTISSNFVHDGSYLTCKNISLGYTFKAINKKYINRLRLYISVQQAFVITGYQGFNPETSDQGNSINGLKLGHDVTTYPVPRTFSFGINANL